MKQGKKWERETKDDTRITLVEGERENLKKKSLITFVVSTTKAKLRCGITFKIVDCEQMDKMKITTMAINEWINTVNECSYVKAYVGGDHVQTN